MKIIKEFKEFAIKGNVFDMAVGIIIGTAFGKVVSSLVSDIVMPLLSILVGKLNFSNWVWVIRAQKTDEAGQVLEQEVLLHYGNLIQVSIDFLIMALAIFVMIKLFNRLRTKAEDETNAQVETPKNIQLLSEIRDLLKNNHKN